jgi:hypothetical protein
MQSMTAEVIAYSMPEVPDCDAAFAVPGAVCGRIQMDRLTYTNMWLGNVKYWDDATLKAVNPTAIANALPHARVRYAYRSDPFGPTVSFLGPMASTALQNNVAWVDQKGLTMAVSIKPTWSIVTTLCTADNNTYISAPTQTDVRSTQCSLILPCTVGSGILAQMVLLHFLSCLCAVFFFPYQVSLFVSEQSTVRHRPGAVSVVDAESCSVLFLDQQVRHSERYAHCRCLHCCCQLWCHLD